MSTEGDESLSSLFLSYYIPTSGAFICMFSAAMRWRFGLVFHYVDSTMCFSFFLQNLCLCLCPRRTKSQRRNSNLSNTKKKFFFLMIPYCSGFVPYRPCLGTLIVMDQQHIL